MIEWLKNIFRINSVDNINSLDDHKSLEEQSKYIWCLVGNIIDKRPNETNQKIINGTKHFSPKTKVYCFPILWGDGYENIKVIGRHRKTNRNVWIIMPAKHITNWRLQKVFIPYVLKVMKTQNGWTDSENDKEKIIEMIQWLQERI